jgi:hypothetical protein
VDTNDTPAGRAHNRRVDLVIMNQSVVVKNQEPALPVPPPHQESSH